MAAIIKLPTHQLCYYKLVISFINFIRKANLKKKNRYYLKGSNNKPNTVMKKISKKNFMYKKFTGL